MVPAAAPTAWFVARNCVGLAVDLPEGGAGDADSDVDRQREPPRRAMLCGPFWANHILQLDMGMPDSAARDVLGTNNALWNISRSKEFGERLYPAEEKIKCALIWRLLQPPR
jgi:hypothetical protein